MKPKLIALNLVLLAALGAVIWQARTRWNEAHEKRNSTLNVRVKPAPVPPAIAAPKPETPAAAKYADVATKNLFAKDRNPNVVIDPPKVEEQKKMPPLPVVFGVLGLPSGTRALMAEKAGAASVPVHAGDKVGEFKIASLDAQNVVFDWNGTQISKKIDELIDRSGPAAAGGAPAAAAVPASTTSTTAAPPRPSGQPVPATPGADIPAAAGQSQKSCVPGDNSPSGTVVDGYRKNVVQTPFGGICTWIKGQ